MDQGVAMGAVDVGADRKVTRGARSESTPTQWRCSYCGDELDPEVVVECDDCLYVYCKDHHDGELHLCAEICAECGPEAFGD